MWSADSNYEGAHRSVQTLGLVNAGMVFYFHVIILIIKVKMIFIKLKKVLSSSN